MIDNKLKQRNILIVIIICVLNGILNTLFYQPEYASEPLFTFISGVAGVLILSYIVTALIMLFKKNKSQKSSVFMWTAVVSSFLTLIAELFS